MRKMVDVILIYKMGVNCLRKILDMTTALLNNRVVKLLKN